jgi:hypothetical protein
VCLRVCVHVCMCVFVCVRVCVSQCDQLQLQYIFRSQTEIEESLETIVWCGVSWGEGTFVINGGLLARIMPNFRQLSLRYIDCRFFYSKHLKLWIFHKPNNRGCNKSDIFSNLSKLGFKFSSIPGRSFPCILHFLLD